MASRPTPRQLALAVARAGALGALALIDPNRLSGARKHLYWLGAGALTSAESLAGDQEQIPGTRPALAVGITGATYGAQDLLARRDKWTMDFLARRGVHHPRRWMAVLTAVGSLAITLFEARRDSALQEARYVWDGQDPVAAEPLPEDVRDIVTGLLDTVDGWGGRGTARPTGRCPVPEQQRGDRVRDPRRCPHPAAGELHLPRGWHLRTRRPHPRDHPGHRRGQARLALPVHRTELGGRRPGAGLVLAGRGNPFLRRGFGLIVAPAALHRPPVGARTGHERLPV